MHEIFKLAIAIAIASCMLEVVKIVVVAFFVGFKGAIEYLSQERKKK